jgi:hypothetical protein
MTPKGGIDNTGLRITMANHGKKWHLAIDS